MDVEQLKLILEAIESAGPGAMQLGIWYIIAGVVPSILGTICATGVAVLVIFAVKNGIKAAVINCQNIDAEERRREAKLARGD